MGGGVLFNAVLDAASAFEAPAVELTAFLAGPQRQSPCEFHSQSGISKPSPECEEDGASCQVLFIDEIFSLFFFARLKIIVPGEKNR